MNQTNDSQKSNTEHRFVKIAWLAHAAATGRIDHNPTKYHIIRHKIYVAIFGRYISLKDSVKDAPWYLRDRLGWPIEIFEDRSLKSLLRVVCQNIRKVTG